MATEAAPESMPTICVYSFAKKERSQICFAPSRSVFLGCFFLSISHFKVCCCSLNAALDFSTRFVCIKSKGKARRGAAIVEPDKLNGQLRLHKEANSTTHTAPTPPPPSLFLCIFHTLCLAKVNKTRASDRARIANSLPTDCAPEELTHGKALGVIGLQKKG